jgi:hypothetical protein
MARATLLRTHRWRLPFRRHAKSGTFRPPKRRTWTWSMQVPLTLRVPCSHPKIQMTTITTTWPQVGWLVWRPT